MRAARRLIRAHPAMAPVWRVLAVALEADDVTAAVADFATSLGTGAGDAADQTRWLVGRKRVTVVTHSASATVERALDAIADRVEGVLCGVSLPGGEGRPLARRLSRRGFAAEVIPDAALPGACGRADLALVGADAVTDQGVVNKAGTLGLALGAAEAGIGCYAIASTHKYLPAWCLPLELSPFEVTPLRLFDAVLSERGPRRPPAVRRAVARVTIPDRLAALA